MTPYQFDRDYDYNYEHGPALVTVPSRPDWGAPTLLPGLGLSLRSPVGVFSGPLLNGRWVDLYARLGYDLLAYKTVRSQAWPSHPWPNCAYIDSHDQLSPRKAERPPFLAADPAWPAGETSVSMTNSYGMPSRDPQVWMADVRGTHEALGTGQGLIVSVVGQDVADYARTALEARQAGADAVEINLSCPNVVTREGSIYTDAQLSRDLCREVKAALQETPLIIKVGYIEEDAQLNRLLEAVVGTVQGVSGINTIPMEIRNQAGEPLLGPDRRVAGVCGDIIRTCGLDFAARLCDWRRRHGADFAVLAGGGIMAPEHIDAYLQTGVDVAMVATAALVRPLLAWEYHTQQAVAPRL